MVFSGLARCVYNECIGTDIPRIFYVGVSKMSILLDININLNIGCTP